MRFTDGFWLMRPGVEAHYAREAYGVKAIDEISSRGPSRFIQVAGQEGVEPYPFVR